MRALRAGAALGLVTALVLGGCSGGGDEPESATTETTEATSTSDTTQPSTTTTVDRTPFCENLRALEALGGTESGADATPAAVMAQTEQMLDLLDEIQATVPAGAPPAVDGVIDDLRAIAEAIGAAAGDVDAAYAEIESSNPELWTRLQDPSTHRAGFDFFAARCGTAFA